MYRFSSSGLTPVTVLCSSYCVTLFYVVIDSDRITHQTLHCMCIRFINGVLLGRLQAEDDRGALLTETVYIYPRRYCTSAA